MKKEAQPGGRSSGQQGLVRLISYMDKQKDERARDVTVACTTKECCALKRDTTRSHGPAEVSLVLGASQVRLISVPVEARLVLGQGQKATLQPQAALSYRRPLRPL